LFWEVIFGLLRTSIAAQRERVEGTAAGRPPDPEIDAPWIQRVQHPETLSDLHRTVMRQHHATRTDADVRSLGTDSRDEDFRRRTSERASRMMLSDPVTLISKPISKPRKLDGVTKSVGSSEPGRKPDIDR